MNSSGSVGHQQGACQVLSFQRGYLEAPKKGTKVAGDSPTKHLDSYVPNTEIVSRKYAQLNEDQRRLQLLDKKMTMRLLRG